MASMRDIKRRRVSIQSTQQITKAMKLVSTVKLQKAKNRAEDSKAYFNNMYDTMAALLSRTGNIEHPYLRANGSEKIGIVVVTSNRGLAGGYNSNITKLITGGNFPKEKVRIYAVGGKGAEALSHRGYEIVQDFSDRIEEPVYGDAKEISGILLKDYMNGKIGSIYLAYTFFKNTVSHIPTLLKLLPMETADAVGEEKEEKAVSENAVVEFEPSEEEVLDLLIPKYLTSILYGAFVEAVASENGARMQAMDSATSNAEEMIEHLGLLYNRARQGAITQELTEIIAGAESLN